MLAAEQSEAYHKITQTLTDRRAGACFVDGPSGTGKSFLYNCLIAFAKVNRFSPLVMATTGLAASPINGITVRKAFAVPIPCTEESLSNMR